MTMNAASRWAVLLTAMMFPTMVTLAVKSQGDLLALAMPSLVVILTIGLQIRILRALRHVPDDQRGNDLPALLIHLMMLIPCLGLAGLLAALS